MSTSTTIYLDQNKDSHTMPIALILDAIRVSVNELIQISYEKYNVAEKEINERIPLIRNAARINKFESEAHVYDSEIEPFMSFRVFPIFFVSQNEVGNFPQYKFKNKKEGAEIYHQSRTLSLLENNNSDLANYIGNVSNDNRFFSISCGDDAVGQLLMLNLAKKLKDKLDTTVYYQRTSLYDNDEVIQIN